MTKLARVFEHSGKGRSEASLLLLRDKKRQSRKLKGSELKADKRQGVFLHDGQSAVGASPRVGRSRRLGGDALGGDTGACG